MFWTALSARRLTGCAVVLCLGTSALAQMPPSSPPPAAKAPAANPLTDPARPVAYIFGNVPVTRQALGEFLMARGGAEKLELFVNKMIIEHEASQRKVTITQTELEAALQKDLQGLTVSKADFVKVVLPRYGKTLYEWMEDVIKPRLMLEKMCHDRVKVEEADLKVQFEREYGEKRRIQLIMWPLGDDQKVIMKEWESIRSSQVEFDRAARGQANPQLAMSAGNVKPICKHLPAQEPIVEKIAFELKPGEVSQVLRTSQGYIVMKLHEVIPPAANVKFEDVKPALEKAAYDEKLSSTIPVFFKELRDKAAPELLYAGPSEWKTPTMPKADVMPTSGTEPLKK